MKVIGITGGIASGKSTVSAIFRQNGHPVVCADEVARDVVAPGTHGFQKIVKTFGQKFVGADGGLNRQLLAKHVFADEQARKILENIIHPEVRKAMERAIDDARSRGTTLLFLDIPLLFETNLDVLCDKTICVYTDEEAQISRHMARSGHTREHTLERMAAQMSLSEKIKLADHVLQNHGTIDDLQTRALTLLKQLERAAVR